MPLPVLDIHMHLAAMDPARTDGGWFPPRRQRSLAFRWIRRVAGLPVENAGFDDEFRALVFTLLGSAAAQAVDAGFGGFVGAGLAFDKRHDWHGTPMDAASDFFVPNAYAFRLASEFRQRNGNAVDERSALLVGASINPYRHDALVVLNRVAADGAVLVKWLPTTQDIDPADPRSVLFARECRELGLPLLIHTGSEGATTNLNRRWNNPRALEPLLETEAVIIAAHAGMRSLPHEASHFRMWRHMLPYWPNLYGDTAALFGLRPRALIRALDKPLVAERLVHGSDWPVPNWPGWYWPGLSWQTIRNLCRIANPLWRDVAVKIAAGLPVECFVRAWQLIPVAAALPFVRAKITGAEPTDAPSP